MQSSTRAQAPVGMGTEAGTVVVLGTGGTIAGTAAQASDNVGYTAAQLGVAQLVKAVPPLAEVPLELEQVAQLDSKDMDAATWLRLAQRVEHHLARDEVRGVVITHGTDTLEETAWFLHRVLGPAKPVVLTAAMRPATALMADGPQNLLDAVTVARSEGARGVVVAFGGEVLGAADVRKRHSYRVNAFSAGDAGPVALVQEGRVLRLRPWPGGRGMGLERLPLDVRDWPWVAVVPSHAGADGRMVRALHEAGVQGVVIAGTGNGTVHHELMDAARQAQAAGVTVWRSSRCADGGVVGEDTGPLPSTGALTAWQARIELMLTLLQRGASAA